MLFISKNFKAGSGSAFLKQLDPDPHSEKTAGSGSAKNECGNTALKTGCCLSDFYFHL